MVIFLGVVSSTRTYGWDPSQHRNFKLLEQCTLFEFPYANPMTRLSRLNGFILLFLFILLYLYSMGMFDSVLRSSSNPFLNNHVHHNIEVTTAVVEETTPDSKVNLNHISSIDTSPQERSRWFKLSLVAANDSLSTDCHGDSASDWQNGCTLGTRGRFFAGKSWVKLLFYFNCVCNLVIVTYYTHENLMNIFHCNACLAGVYLLFNGCYIFRYCFDNYRGPACERCKAGLGNFPKCSSIKYNNRDCKWCLF